MHTKRKREKIGIFFKKAPPMNVEEIDVAGCRDLLAHAASEQKAVYLNQVAQLVRMRQVSTPFLTLNTKA